MKTVTRYLKYQFTEAELKEKAVQLARECRQNEEIEDDKKRVMSDFKAKIDAHQAQISLLSGHINSGDDFRDVECHVNLNSPIPGRKTFMRIDTAEIVAEEDMTKEEFQMELPLEGEANER